MHEQLVAAAQALGLDGGLPHVRAAAENSRSQVEFARGYLTEHMSTGDEASDVVAFGSLGREEFTAESDFDYLVIAYQLHQDLRGHRTLLATADDLRREFAVRLGKKPDDETRAPGATKLFGVVASAMDLSEHIGLQDDTNHSQTRRLLLLEESVSLFQQVKHRNLVKRIIERYLDGYPQATKGGVPRFLLNDVVRYWRTLTVDYQAKVWNGSGDDWGLRYLKLIVSRKLAYAGTLASLLTCSEDNPATVDNLLRQFTMPPLARLAQLHELLASEAEASGALGRALTLADTFLMRSADAGWRNRVKTVRELSQAADVPDFQDMRAQARALQNDLETIFFASRALGSKSRKYLAF